MVLTANIEIWEDSDATVMARITGDDGAIIVQADVSSIARTTYDCSQVPPVAVESGTAINVAASVFDELQTDARWDADSTGYNFRNTVPASVLDTGGRVYRTEYAFTGASSESYHVVANITTKEILGS